MNFTKKNSFIFLLITIFLFGNCSSESSSKKENKNPLAVNTGLKENKFKDYWYNGKAELTSYSLEQARYGEIHQGDAVLIFVTEPFSKKKQVKMDNQSSNPNDAVSILKLNATRKFNTGIYPYSTMQSIFTPIDIEKNPNTLKIATSSQEWCGHTFMQLNLEKNVFKVQSNSYFESEGDKESKVGKALLEEEVFNRIRISPKTLPIGKIDIIPSTLFTRLKHTKFQVEKATTSLSEQNNKMIYKINYESIDRKVSIVFDKKFPHQILSWEETHKSGFGSGAKTLTTKATKKKSILLDYWNKNSVEDLKYLEKLY